MRSAKQLLVGTLGTALAVTGLTALAPTPSAHAASSGLVISEVYGGGGNSGATYTHDFIELYNRGDVAVSLAGKSLQYRSATSLARTGASNVFALPDVEVGPGEHFLVRGASQAGVGAPLPVTPDAESPLQLGGSNGQVFLATGTAAIDADGEDGDDNAVSDPAVIDFVGFGTAVVREGAAAAPAPSSTASISRTGGADTDQNGTDFTVTSAMTPTSAPAGPLAATDPSDAQGYVGEPIDAIRLAATGGTPPYSWKTSELPAGLTLAGDTISGTPTAVGTTEVTATVTDAGSPAGTAETTFSIAIGPEPAERSIAAIQGTDAAESPEKGNRVTTTGVVTAMYRDPAFASSSIDGMYIQTGGTGGTTDTTPGASDAVFVYGTHAMPAGIEIGDSVAVTGQVDEFHGSTQLIPRSGGVTELDAPLAAVEPLAIAYPTTEAAREAQEGMLLAPTDTFTVTNTYNLNTYAEVGLATGDKPLIQPTEVADDDDAAALQAVKDDNAARGVILDDGTSVNYMTNSAAKGQPLPWLSPSNPIRVGAEATITGPVVLEFRNDDWKFQPTSPVFDEGAGTATFENTRPAEAAPQPVGGDLKIATFNVLNYFNTTGQQYVANGAGLTRKTHCTYYDDRAGTPIANNRCGLVNPPGSDQPNDGSGPRGAATSASLARQQAKIVTAINALDADIVALQEIENSIKLVGETDRDDAVRSLVAALNEAAGPGTWRFVHSPGEAVDTSPGGAVSQQDTIRPAFIYRAATVSPVGASDILFNTTEFANAREPLAQAFKPRGTLDSEAFAVIANHFKSKGDSATPATGDNANDPDTGAFNGDRVRQAEKLLEFADSFAQARGTEAVFLAGDFNAYSMEDPIWTLEQGGFERIESDTEGEESYSYSGLSGSLDHVLGNEAAMDMVTGADIWDINASESIAFQYSRYNYNVTDFWQPNQPWAASDHNPEIVGIDVTPAHKEIQVLATNDFHGRILPDGSNAAGASVLAGAVKELRADNPNTIFAAAGDLIGASTFESFILNDKPTIDALNEAGLEVSAVGNHELDQGYDDLVGRVMDHDHEEGGAEWEYIAANLEEPAGEENIADTWTKTVDGVDVGFVGAVTEDLRSLVSPSGIEGVTVTDVVEATNEAAADLRAEGAEVVVLLVHEGSPTTDCSSPNFTDENTVWGNITQNVSADVDAIVSGHTHLAYNCSFTVPEWAEQGRKVTKRPVVSAGQYGTNLNQLVFTFDEVSGKLVATSQEIIGIAGTGFPNDPAVDPIVAQAKAEADVLGAEVLGEIEGEFNRARLANGDENRGGESTLGNKVAEVQRWATSTEEAGAAQIAFMNPGGLRADMKGVLEGGVRTLTYKQAAVVQPFANTLVNMDLTGAQIETVLEQQWQRTASGAVPSRPFLRLGVSEGFTYTYEEVPVTVAGTETFEGEVTGMWLDGEPLDPAATYSVTVNSFLASGGDNFWALADGADKRDTGKVDLAAMVEYMDEFAPEGSPLPVDHSQRAVEVEFPASAPESYEPGDEVVFDVGSWAMSTAADTKDAEIRVELDGELLDTFPVDNTIGTAAYDHYGTASVAVALPDDLGSGSHELTLVGAETGTEVVVPIAVDEPAVAPTITVTDGKVHYGKETTIDVSVTADGVTPTGSVTLMVGDKEIGGAELDHGTATVTIPAKTLSPRDAPYEVTAVYGGDDSVLAGEGTGQLTVGKGFVTVNGKASPARVVVHRTRAGVAVTTSNVSGLKATGTVTLSIAGMQPVTVRLVDGKATVRFSRAFRTTGTKKLKVRYNGSATLRPAADYVTIRVVR